jgi:hypothetical protein
MLSSTPTSEILPKTPNDSEKPKDSASSVSRFVLPVLLLLVGVCLWLNAAQTWPTKLQFEFGFVALVISSIPPVSGCFTRMLDQLRNVSPRMRTLIAIGWVIVASLYIYSTAIHQGRRFEMVYHDEFMFRLQTVMLAHGRLWMPAHPLADFFESFYVLVKPVYAAIYYPGTAIVYTPGVWLGLKFWVIPLVLSGSVIGFTYRIVAELVDGAVGCIAALMLLATPEFRRIAIMNMGQPPALVLGLLLILLWLHWRRSPSWLATFFIGLCTGLCAITRPIDAICFALPVGVMMFVPLFRTPRKLGVLWLIFLAGVIPFVALQLVFDRGVTGHWLRTPVQEVLDREMPGLEFGIGRTHVPIERPHTTLPQKIEFYDNVIVPFLKGDHRGGRFYKWYDQHGRELVPSMLPIALLIVFAPIVLLSRKRLAWIMIAPIALFLALYPMYPSFLPHYLFVFMPACGVLVLLGIERLFECFPRARTIVQFCMVAMLIGYLPPIDRHVRDVPAYMNYPSLPAIEDRIAQLPKMPSIILFRFHPGQDNPQEEPVHNSERIWPDDELFIRAHDLGSRNRELIDYYAKRQPNRRVYLLNRGENSIRYLGAAKDLPRSDARE